MSINTKIAIMAALILGGLGIASAAPANDAAPPQARSVGDWTENRGIVDCPTLEGYPDCHPDARASWGDWSASSRPYRSYYLRRP